MNFTNNLLARLDPRTKIVSFLAIILCMVSTPITRSRDFGFYFLLILAMGLLSNVAPGRILKRVGLLMPFVLVIALFVPFLKEGHTWWSLKIYGWKLDITYEGAWTFLNIIVKSSLSILLLTVASATTSFPDFLKGLDLLRFPRLVILIMAFMYRYVFVLLDETRRLMRARSLRYFGSRYREQFRVTGYMIGVLFIRTFERAERIYHAMAARGFQGEIISGKRFRFSSLDFFFITSIIVTLIVIVSGFIYRIECVKSHGAHLWQGL